MLPSLQRRSQKGQHGSFRGGAGVRDAPNFSRRISRGAMVSLAEHYERSPLVWAVTYAAAREPLAETEEHQQNWSEDPDLVVRGQAADEEGRSAHQDQCQDEDGLPSQFVTDMTEEERANRAGASPRSARGTKERRVRRPISRR